MSSIALQNTTKLTRKGNVTTPCIRSISSVDNLVRKVGRENLTEPLVLHREFQGFLVTRGSAIIHRVREAFSYHFPKWSICNAKHFLRPMVLRPMHPAATTQDYNR